MAGIDMLHVQYRGTGLPSPALLGRSDHPDVLASLTVIAHVSAGTSVDRHDVLGGPALFAGFSDGRRNRLADYASLGWFRECWRPPAPGANRRKGSGRRQAVLLLPLPVRKWPSGCSPSTDTHISSNRFPCACVHKRPTDTPEGLPISTTEFLVSSVVCCNWSGLPLVPITAPSQFISCRLCY